MDDLTEQARKEFVKLGKLIFPHEKLVPIIEGADTFDYGQPATAMADIEERVAAVYREQADVTELPDFGIIFEALSSAEVQRKLLAANEKRYRELSDEAAKDAPFASLVQLMDAADARIPFVSAVVLLRGNRDEEIWNRLECNSLLMAAANENHPEKIARALMNVAGEPTEKLYKPYLRTIWSFRRLSKGKWPKFPSTFGALVNQVAEDIQGEFPGLIDRDVRLRRNAKCHGSWRYQPKNESVLLWDENTPAREIAVEDLAEPVITAIELAGPTLEKLRHLCMERLTLKSGLLGAVFTRLRDLLGVDATRRRAAIVGLALHCAREFGPVIQFLRRSSTK